MCVFILNEYQSVSAFTTITGSKSFCVCCFQLILTPHFPFKLNGKVMQVLIGIFLYHDFSVRNFIKGIQVQSPFEIQPPPPPGPCVCRSNSDIWQTNGLLCLGAAGPTGALSLSASQCALLQEKGRSS